MADCNCGACKDCPRAWVGQRVLWDEGRMSGRVVNVSEAGMAFVRNEGALGQLIEQVPIAALEIRKDKGDV